MATISLHAMHMPRCAHSLRCCLGDDSRNHRVRASIHISSERRGCRSVAQGTQQPRAKVRDRSLELSHHQTRAVFARVIVMIGPPQRHRDKVEGLHSGARLARDPHHNRWQRGGSQHRGGQL